MNALYLDLFNVSLRTTLPFHAQTVFLISFLPDMKQTIKKLKEFSFFRVVVTKLNVYQFQTISDANLQIKNQCSKTHPEVQFLHILVMTQATELQLTVKAIIQPYPQSKMYIGFFQ